MSLQSCYIPESKTHLEFGSGSKRVRDYTFSYAYVGLSVPNDFMTVFPRTGYLIFTLVTGKDLKTQFMNYKRSVTRPNHLYISGLFSDSSLLIKQRGTGGGYSMKVHPVVGYHFLKVPMQELLDRQIRICDILEKQGRKLEKIEANYTISSLDDARIEQFFEDVLPPKRAYREDPIYHAVNIIINQRGLLTVKGLAKQCCMSRRTLNRQFLLKVGLSPQKYAKIWQTKYAMDLIRQNPGSSLPEIAFKAGYYDVAHLARDFRNNVSFPPTGLHQDINPLSQNYLDTPGPGK